MLFNSYIFILLFFPLCIFGYFGLNRLGKKKAAMVFLFGMSLWFYGYNSVNYLAVIIFSILLNYVIYRIITKKFSDNKDRAAKAAMIAGVVINLGILAFYKYMDFFIENINAVFKTNIGFLRIALPLGISFFTFQQISFIVDTYRKEVTDVKFVNYACFVAFFPQLIAGPIVSHDEILPQFEDDSKKQFNIENFTRGLYLFTLGLAKKVLIADKFSDCVSYCYATLSKMNSGSAAICIVSFAIQLYFDFSGYCDMAVGIGKMLNIDIPINFNSPYKARTIIEFWERWHMTLTRFFRKYIYFPLGGSRKGSLRTYFNIMVVFVVSGFWHGAAWTYVVWGAMHGVFMVITRRFKKVFDKIPFVINWFITFLFVAIALSVFRAPSLGDAATVIKALFSFDFSTLDPIVAQAFRHKEIAFLLRAVPIEKIIPYFSLLVYMAVAFYFMVFSKNAVELSKKFKPTFFTALVTVFLFAWSLCSVCNVQEFLYFNF